MTHSRAPFDLAGRSWFWPLLIVILLAVFFHPVLLGGRVFSSPDAQAPQGFAVYANAWRQETGHYPLWNPFIFCGMPSYASLAYNPDVYFPDWVFKPLGHAAPPMLWLVVYYMVGALALYALLRDRGADPWPAALGGLVFVLSPNLIAVGGHGHGSQLVCSAWLPVVLLFLHRWLARGRPVWLGLLALALGCQLLRAHVQIAYYTWMAVALYVLFYVLARRGRTAAARHGGGGRQAATGAAPAVLDRPSFATPLGRGLGGTALALVLGLALAAVLLLPVMGYTPHSIRGAGEGGGVGWDYATGWSMSFLELVTFVIPGALGFGGQTYWGTMPFTDYPNAYAGILPLFFMGLGLWMTRGRGMGFFVTLAVLGVIVALGDHTIVYRLFYDYLPYWKKFRIPVMILVLVHLAIAAMMAHGLTALVRRAVGAPRPAAGVAGLATLLRWKAVAGVALVVLVVAAAGPLGEWYVGRYVSSQRVAAYVGRGQLTAAQARLLGDRAAQRAHADTVRSLALVTLAAAGGVLLLRRKVPAPVYLGGVTLLIAFDLVPIDRTILEPVTQPRAVLERVTQPDAATRFLAARHADASFRIMPLEEFSSNRFATFGLPSVGGYHAAKPAVYQELASAIGLDDRRIFATDHGWRWLDALAVRYFVTRQPLPESERLRLAHAEDWRVYENPGAASRAYLVGQAEVVPRWGPETLARLVEPGFDPLAVALVDGDPGPLAGPGVGGQVRFTERGLNRLELEVESDGAALLVVSDTWDPGWEARVDGEPRHLWRANHAFRAVRVEGGRQSVELTYHDPRLRAGLLVTLAAALGIVALLAARPLARRWSGRQGGEASAA
ncbi:MAG: YfhO family protein [Candidatus Eiseniibacteriota bacterium]|jgi:hypothetical protein